MKSLKWSSLDFSDMYVNKEGLIRYHQAGIDHGYLALKIYNIYGEGNVIHMQNEVKVTFENSIFKDVEIINGSVFYVQNGAIELFDCVFDKITTSDSTIYLYIRNNNNYIMTTSVTFTNCISTGSKTGGIKTSTEELNLIVDGCDFLSVKGEGEGGDLHNNNNNPTNEEEKGGVIDMNNKGTNEIKNSRFITCGSTKSDCSVIYFVLNGYSILIQNCVFDSCYGKINTGWAVVFDFARVGSTTSGSEIKDCIFINTIGLKLKIKTLITGCIFKEYINNNSSHSASMINCLFSEKEEIPSSIGIKDCVFVGISMYQSSVDFSIDYISLEITNTTFESIHKYSGNGGAIYGLLGVNSSVLISDCTFSDCSVPSVGAGGGGNYGGAIYLYIEDGYIVK
jgi:hypothetical protein